MDEAFMICEVAYWVQLALDAVQSQASDHSEDPSDSTKGREFLDCKLLVCMYVYLHSTFAVFL